MREPLTLGPLLAYGGKDGCTDLSCTRAGYNPETQQMGPCIGWHCPYCHEPTSSQGHGLKFMCEEGAKVIAAWEASL